MDDYADNDVNGPFLPDDDKRKEEYKLEEISLVDFDAFLKSDTLDHIAESILEGTYGETDFMKKDILDRFLDFIYFKVQTGNPDIIHWAYPAKKMMDSELEKKVTALLNEHLYPEIVLRLLKFFTRNLHAPDSNLYIANLIYSENIIRAIFETFKLFKGDIFISEIDKRSLNVKKIQQFTARSENRLSSPLDAAARLKYILEFFLIKYDLEHVYTEADVKMFP